jgi:hypothetical protein
MMRVGRLIRALVWLVPLSVAAGGCTKTLAFGTATKFALDISQRADQTIDVSMGYDRAEIASIPAKANTDATQTDDAYAVLGTFYVTYGNPWTMQPIRVNQFFATGMAARTASETPRFQDYFGRSASVIENLRETEAGRMKP